MDFSLTKTKNEDVRESIIKENNNYLMPGKIVEKLSKTIARIENENINATGFFMKIIQEIEHNFVLLVLIQLLKRI